MKRLLHILALTSLLVITGILYFAVPAMAATTADITVNATPEYIAITCNQSTYSFGTVATSSNTSTATGWAGITNSSSVQTDQTISVTTSSWSGGATWTHSDTDTPGADTAGLVSNRGGSWGTGDIIVKNASPNFIYENCPALTDYAFGLQLDAPTSFSDGTIKTITVRITAAAG